MLASRHAPEDVVKVMEGNPFVIEKKHDGERIQIHKSGQEIRLFSRNSNNVTDIYGEKLIPIIQQHVLVSRCILDGELVLWDSILEKFEEFGKLKTFGRSCCGYTHVKPTLPRETVVSLKMVSLLLMQRTT